MRTNPFNDVWLFLIGQTNDHNNVGPFFWALLTYGFWALIIASLVIAWQNWRADPAQRSGHHLAIFGMRFFIGCMWFQGSLWKLPLPVSGGFEYWNKEIVGHAAFDIHRWIATNIFLPALPLINPIVFLTELGLGIALMLGILVRPFAALGILFVVHLWFGLYRHPHEWPWLYIFLIFTQAFFILNKAGESLGLDAMMKRRPFGPLDGEGIIARLYRRFALGVA